jgi:parallel beta-helix repeat protein
MRYLSPLCPRAPLVDLISVYYARGVRRNALILAAAALVLAFAPAAADASHVECGDVLTTDTRLDSDLECAEGTALTIAASNVTLELGGHTVAGTFADESVGVRASGHTGIVVRNGAVRQFDVDVLLEDVSDSLVRDLTDAVVGALGNGNTLRGNTESAGIAVRGDRNLVLGNGVSSNPSLDDATWLSASGADNVIAHNVVKNVGATSADTTAYGLLLRMDGGLVAHNVVTGAASFPQGSDVTVTGIHLSGQGALARKNVASGLIDGFEVWGPFELTDNLAFSNLDDGIEVGVSGATLTRNEANDNGDLGIEAVPATIDGGGNRASGNGNPAQCVGVACR